MILSMTRYDSAAGGGPIRYASSAHRTWRACRSASEKTATVRIPISWQARSTRTAISPRLAIRIFLNKVGLLQGNVAVLARRVYVTLVRKHLECLDDLGPGLLRHDDLVDEPEFGRLVGRGEPGAVVGDEFRLGLLRVVRLDEFLPEDDADRPVRAHHGDLGGRVGEVHVRPDVLGRHDVVRAAVRLAGDDGHLRDGRLGEGLQELRPVLDDPPVLLAGPPPKTPDVDQR